MFILKEKSHSNKAKVITEEGKSCTLKEANVDAVR